MPKTCTQAQLSLFRVWQAVLFLGDDCILTSGFRSDCRHSPQVCLDSLPCTLGPSTVSGRLLLERYGTQVLGILLTQRTTFPELVCYPPGGIE